MKILFVAIAVAVMLPAAAIVVIALGPVALGVLCAVGFGLVVSLFVGLFVDLGRLFDRHEHRKYVLR